MPWSHDDDRGKQRLTKDEAIRQAAAIRSSGHSGGSPEIRVDTYCDSAATFWRIRKVKKWEANESRLR